MDEFRSMAGEYELVEVSWYLTGAAVDGQPKAKRKSLLVEVRRLTAAESALVTDWVQKSLPPVIPPATPQEVPRYNLDDPEYRKTHVKNLSLARAVALYHGVKLFRESFDAERGDRQFEASDFRDWVEKQAPESVLEKLWNAVLVNDAEEEEKARLFT